MTFFLTPFVFETKWEGTLTQAYGQDTLSALYKNGSLAKNVKFNNVTLINNDFSSISSKTTDFSIEINGLVNPVIYIGCNCSAEQISQLKTLLSPLDFNYTGRNIAIRVINEFINDIKNETNILFLMEYKNLTPFKNKLNKFLERGGTIFMLSDLIQDQVMDGYLNNTFGLNWNSETGATTLWNFYDTTNPGNVSYKISKYFVNISGHPDTTSFLKFTQDTSKNRIKVDNRTVIWDSTRKFSFVKINKGVINGNGRTVWFADYATDQDTNYLLKAAVMWASGERYNMNPYIKTYQKKYVKTKYIISDKDPYQVELTLWKIY